MTRAVLVAWALLSRVAVWTSMMIADFVIPDHNPGDDVLRLIRPTKPTSSCEESENECRWHEAAEIPLWQHVMASPLTKWDAARFLSLAIEEDEHHGASEMRDPSLCVLTHCHGSNQSTVNISLCVEKCRLTAEQAHAFFPGFPTLVGHWMRPCRKYTSMHPVITAALAAFLLNTSCFIVAMLALYEFTLLLAPHRAKHLATTAALLFIWNPASVFFTTAYSEPLFAASSWTGHLLWAAASTATEGPISLTASTMRRIAAVFCWMVASWTRSNGMMNAVWLGGTALCQSVHVLVSSERAIVSRLLKLSGVLLIHGLAALYVIYPIYRYEESSRHLHCDSRIDNANYQTPDWCNNDNVTSIYGYVQRTHWNVGFLRYYELKQLPNFLLAAPVLFYSFLAVYEWIRASWVRCPQKSIIPWVLYSMQLAAVPSPSHMDSNKGSMTSDMDPLLLGPQLLVHYAVLAAAAAVGLLVAHVQISTRLLLSSCPALYWYLATVFWRRQRRAPSVMNHGARLIVAWCIGYNVIGIVLHVNFLPWT